MDSAFLSELVEKAGRKWGKVCEYEHPRLSAVHLTHEPLDLSRYTDEQLVELERLHAIGRGSAGAVPDGMGPTTH